VCREIRPSSDFTRLPSANDGLQSQCKPCKAAAQRRYYRRNQQDPDYRRALAERAANQKKKRPKRSNQVSRQPLPDFARGAGWKLRADVERLERIFTDDRFTQNRQQVDHNLRVHLLHAAEVCQDLLSRLGNPTEG
jgi:hypothetical protein